MTARRCWLLRMVVVVVMLLVLSSSMVLAQLRPVRRLHTLACFMFACSSGLVLLPLVQAIALTCIL